MSDDRIAGQLVLSLPSGDMEIPIDITEEQRDQFLFVQVLDVIAQQCYQNSKAHGFWPPGSNLGECSPRNKGEMIALMHSELSEMLEGVRKPKPDQHCPEFTSEEIEAADTLIRLLDYCAGWNLRLGQATLAKMAFNVSRPVKHGKAF